VGVVFFLLLLLGLPQVSLETHLVFCHFLLLYLEPLLRPLLDELLVNSSHLLLPNVPLSNFEVLLMVIAHETLFHFSVIVLFLLLLFFFFELRPSLVIFIQALNHLLLLVNLGQLQFVIFDV